MNGHPVLKSTASLKLSTPEALEPQPSSSNCFEGNKQRHAEQLQDAEPSELQKLLTAKEKLLPKPKHQTESLRTTSKPLNLLSVGVQCKVKTAEKSTNYITRKLLPKKSTDISTYSLTTHSSPSKSDKKSVFDWTSETESSEYYVTKDTDLRIFLNFLNLIHKNPKRYLGLPKQLNIIICENSDKKVSELDLIITLFKIRQNDSMIRISEQFQVSMSALTTIFHKGIESLANFFQNLVYLPLPIHIKKQLPTVFKVRYSNVQCILDCFEIEIEKPSDPMRQAQTWSQYKSCNTIKYLIGCTPNGFVAFISKGFGGRMSDKAILERSNLINILPFNAVVMADRGFKEVEAHLMAKGIKLLRPPSVFSGIKPTKEQVIESKVIASLRVHVERVIRRVREYHMLKPHAVVKYSHVAYMDHIVTIGCGLLNLQKEIIKST